jgi:hypothetical protein
MKKVLSVLLTLVASCCFYLTGCNTPPEEQETVKYSDVYTYNETHHWRKQIGGSGVTEYEEHVNGSGKCECGLYFECNDLVYELRTVYGKYGYCVKAYNGDDVNAYEHIEIPAFHQEEGDEEPIPVIAIAGDVFSTIEHKTYKAIKSVKLNEGLLFLGNGAFEGTSIEEVVIPDSVIGGSLTYDFSRWPTHGGLYNVFASCSNLKSVDTGNGLQIIGMYTFAYCNSLTTVKYGSNLKEIRQRAFYEAYGYENVVLPSTVISLPECSIFDKGESFDENNNNNDLEMWLSEVRTFPYAENIFLSITKETYRSMVVPIAERDRVSGMPLDKDGNELDPNVYETLTDFGFVEGWGGFANVYYLGEWHYDDNGNPVPNK